MNPFEFVLVILGMVFVFTLMKNRMAAKDQWRDPDDQTESLENFRLREEVQELKERIKVLERITVEKENSLAQQIEELRDR